MNFKYRYLKNQNEHQISHLCTKTWNWMTSYAPCAFTCSIIPGESDQGVKKEVQRFSPTVQSWEATWIKQHVEKKMRSLNKEVRGSQSYRSMAYRNQHQGKAGVSQAKCLRKSLQERDSKEGRWRSCLQTFLHQTGCSPWVTVLTFLQDAALPGERKLTWQNAKKSALVSEQPSPLHLQEQSSLWISLWCPRGVSSVTWDLWEV